MESVSRFVFLVALVLSLSFLSNPCEAKGPQDLIEKTCQHAVFHNLCLLTLRSAPKTDTTDLKGLAAVSIQNLINIATKISGNIEKLVNATTDPVIQQCLSDCSEEYINTIDLLGSSLEALDAQKYSDVRKELSAVLGVVVQCEEGFTSEPGRVSLLKEANRIISQLCSNALAITLQLAPRVPH